MLTKLDRAIELADEGYAVFPLHSMNPVGRCSCGDGDCLSKAKHPRVSDWQGLATQDEDDIRAWWEKWPEANIGIATGEVSDVWVLDLDLKDDGPSNFLDYLGGTEVTTRCARTGGGGAHLYFRYDSDMPVRNRGGIIPGVDVRGDGGYVVAPGSLHESGAAYEWLTDDDTIGAPNIVLELVHGSRVNGSSRVEAASAQDEPLDARERADIIGALRHLKADNREDWLEVCFAIHDAHSGDEGFRLWDEWSQGTQSGNYDEKSQRSTWGNASRMNVGGVTINTLYFRASAQGYKGLAPEVSAAMPAVTPKESGSWGEPTAVLQELRSIEFPIHDCMPSGVLRDLALGLASSVQVPAELPAMMMLPVLATCIAGRYVIDGGGWQEPAALWMVCAMGSGGRKSEIIGRLRAPLADWTMEQSREFSAANPLHEPKLKLLKKAYKDALESPGAPEVVADAADRAATAMALHEAQAPKRATVMMDDATPEGLAAKMAMNNGRMLIFSAEANALGFALGRHNGGEPNLGIYLSGHAGEYFASDRVTNSESRTMERATLSIAMAAQPGMLSELFAHPKAVDSGLIARFMFGLPGRRLDVGALRSDPLSARLQQGWNALCLDLLHGEFGTEPRVVTLSEQARQVFDAEWLYARGKKNQEPEGSILLQWYAKLHGAILRIALALHAERLRHTPDALVLDEQTMRYAVAWRPYLEENFKRMAGRAARDPNEAIAKRMLEWLVEHKQGGQVVYATKVYEGIRTGLGLSSRRQADAPFALLEEYRWIERVDPKSKRIDFSVREDIEQRFNALHNTESQK